jgi:hypothetical protein
MDRLCSSQCAFWPVKGGGITAAKTGFMMTVMLIFAALVAAVLFVELVSATKAPIGYQDDDGLHFGSDHITDSSDFENPS